MREHLVLSRVPPPARPLTSLERATLEAFISAIDLEEASDWLSVSESTIRRRLSTMRRRLKVENNRQLIAKAVADGLISDRVFS